MSYFSAHRSTSVSEIATAVAADLVAAGQADPHHANDVPAALAGVAAYLTALGDAPTGKVWVVAVSGQVGGIVTRPDPKGDQVFDHTGQTFNINATLEVEIP